VLEARRGSDVVNWQGKERHWSGRVCDVVLLSGWTYLYAFILLVFRRLKSLEAGGAGSRLESKP